MIPHWPPDGNSRGGARPAQHRGDAGRTPGGDADTGATGAEFGASTKPRQQGLLVRFA